MHIQELTLSEWGNVLPETGFEAFHLPEALRIIADHSPGELHLLGGFKGEEPIGLFPLQARSKLGIRLLLSPPLGLGIGRLGPLIMQPSPKQRKRERTNKEFIEAVLEELEHGGRSTLVRLACSPRYPDPRSFEWAGFDITPAFTYRIDVDGNDNEQLLRSFSRDLRKDIRKHDDSDVSIRRGGIDEVRRTFESLRERYREQKYTLPIDWEYVRDLFEAMDDRARVYVAETGDGDFLSGMVILYSNDTAYFWKGGTKTRRTVSPNSHLHWRVIEDILDDPELASITQYDLYTANNERLTKYKSKFGGDLHVYYTIESTGTAMTVAKQLYRLSAFGRHSLGS